MSHLRSCFFRSLIGRVIASDEKSFLIDEALEFQAGEYDTAPTFSWKDLSGEPGDSYEFVAQGANGPTSAFFMTSLLKAVYERKNLKSSENVSDADLQALLNVYVELPQYQTNP